MNANYLQIPNHIQLPADTSRDLLSFALFLAIAIHILIIFGVYGIALSESSPPTLEVTVSLHQSEQAPELVEFLAKHSQQGSGNHADKSQITTDRIAELPAPTIREANLESAAPQQRRRAETFAVLTTDNYSERSASSAERSEPDQGQQRENIDSSLQKEVASLQAKLDKQRLEYSRMPRINRLTAASTRSSQEASYLHYWVQRIEQTGNSHYPEEVRRKGIYGYLQLAVTLMPDGRVESIEVLKSSGKSILDQAAIRIVHQSAPFKPFPQELREWDKFEIIRTWQFIAGDQLKTGN